MQDVMTDFTETIKKNLALFPGISKSDDRVEKLNLLLNNIHKAGYTKLIDNFCSRNDDQANDIVFECWVCQMLGQNNDVKNLQYEPAEANPPDFRFDIEGVCFDIQVKKLHNTENEMVKRVFERECRKQLGGIKKPWFISYRLSKDLQREDINPVFSYIKNNIRNRTFTAMPTLQEASMANQYFWEKQGKKMVSFSFSQKNKVVLGIIPGVIHDADPEGDLVSFVPIEPVRSAIERLLKKSKATFTRKASETQSNVVIIKADSSVWNVEEDSMADALYGDEGLMFLEGSANPKTVRGRERLFRKDKFSNITGVILVPQEASFTTSDFEGLYFCNPFQGENIKKHPKLFQQIKFYKFWD